MQESVERPRSRRRVFAALTIGAAAIATAGIALAPAAEAFPAVGTTTISASLGSPDTGHGGTTGTQIGSRLYRDGNASNCASPKSFPGAIANGNHVYDAYPVSNPYSAPLCVTASLSTPGGASIFLVAYTSYNPASPTSGYLADTGSSASAGNPAAMSFIIPAHTTVSLVASDVDQNANGQAYTIDVSAPVPAAPVPNNAPASEGLITGVNIITPQGSTVNWTASGYAPGAPVTFAIYNAQTYKKQFVLPTVTANSNGTATYTGPVPYTTGIKYVAAIGYKSNGKVLHMTAQTRFM